MQLSLKKQYLLATALLLSTTNITAKEISYDYLQGGYESLTDSSIPDNDLMVMLSQSKVPLVLQNILPFQPDTPLLVLTVF